MGVILKNLTKIMVQKIGDTDILKLPKTAFLCSRKVPASVVLKCYDWAIEQRAAGNCVISGFHSQIEYAGLSASNYCSGAQDEAHTIF
jgi:hypothetical protein